MTENYQVLCSVTGMQLLVDLVTPFPSLKLPSQKKMETSPSSKTGVKQSEL